MTRRLFLRNYVKFLAMLLVPLVLLGGLSLVLTTQDVARNMEAQQDFMFRASIDNVDAVLTQLQAISLNLSMRPGIMQKLYLALNDSSGDLSSSAYDTVSAIVQMLFAVANSNQHIHSIYIYLPNENGYLINSLSGLSYLPSMADQAWFTAYQENADKLIWNLHRYVPRYTADPRPLNTLSVFRKAASARLPDGIIVLNIDIGKVNTTIRTIVPDGRFYVFDDSGEMLFTNTGNPGEDTVSFAALLAREEDSFETEIGRRTCIVHKEESARYPGWRYVSIIDRDTVYHLPDTIRNSALALILASVVLGAFMAMQMTRANVRGINKVVSTFEMANRREPLPVAERPPQDIYGYVIERINNIFMSNDSLNLQLAEKNYRLQALEFMALRTQIRPHFLSNTLEIIHWKIIGLTNGPNAASGVVENLSKILRYSLADTLHSVLMRQEIDIVDCYIEIQRIRYEHFGGLTWQVDAGLEAARVLKFMVQPIVENCFQHGFQGAAAVLTVQVRVFARDSRLNIQIIDNGVGIAAEELAALRERLHSGEAYVEQHIGLVNTNSRIQMIYGDAYGLSIYSKPGVGTMVWLLLPLVLTEDEDETVRVLRG